MASDDAKRAKDPKDSSSYLSSLSSFSPWSSRSGTPKPPSSGGRTPLLSDKQQRAIDHTVSHRHRLSLRNYPKDCPPPTVQWFHAIDVPKRKPKIQHADPTPQIEKPAALPKKFIPFSNGDSRAIEAAFQRLAEEEEDHDKEKLKRSSEHKSQEDHAATAKSKDAIQSTASAGTKVAVNEDYLFDVDIEARELLPAYWLGPIYEVRRGTWFFADGSTLRPCEENLATQLEEGYLKIKPWTFPPPLMTRQQRSNSITPIKIPPSRFDARADSTASVSGALSKSLPRKGSADSLKDDQLDGPTSDPAPMKAFRLFGSYMNSVVTYQDATTAWLVNDDFLMKMSSTLYERFAGGGHFAGMKVVRGYSDPSKRAEMAEAKMSISAPLKAATTAENAAATVGSKGQDPAIESDALEEPRMSASETRRRDLHRQMSSLVDAATTEDTAMQEEEVRRRDEKEIRDDYQDHEGDDQGREIEHLILVTHGIGQRLGLRLESVNFVHDVNTFRKSIKAVYNESPDLLALNNEVGADVKNSRVQVLPICWRHLLDFPKQSIKHNRAEHDLGDADFSDEQYPNLADITIEGVPAVRNLITDLAMDILLYQSPAYKDHITRIVLEECNRTYQLFKQRNPNFNGKVSMVGHSLGSAVMFDILCGQQIETAASSRQHSTNARQLAKEKLLSFEVEDFYALGSPIGMFQMLKGCSIAARQDRLEIARSLMEGAEDPFAASTQSSNPNSVKALNYVEITTSSPRCAQVFNIFHPTDPIAYRIEPLISPAMATLKPQPLPYTKKGIFTAPVGQGLTGIGNRVGQSVSGLWSSLSTGVASSLLNRSLGISSQNASRLGQAPATGQALPIQGASQAQGGGLNRASSLKIPNPSNTGAASPRKRSTVPASQQITTLEDPSLSNPDNELPHPTTLLDTEIQTLYSGFQNRRTSQTPPNPQDPSSTIPNDSSPSSRRDLEDQGRRLKREERKVRALNSNGRVDYAIQEGAFDISLLASIASHLSYWSDEDVSHFIISQLLSRQRVVAGGPGGGGEVGKSAGVQAVKKEGAGLGHRRSSSMPVAR